MPVEVIMPKVDMDMASGKVMTWHVAEGEAVTKGDPLFDIETDKAAMEVEASDSGILHHMTPEGTDVPIGAPVAWLYAEGEDVGEPPSKPSSSSSADIATSRDSDVTEEPPEEPSENTAPPKRAEPQSSDGKTRATPLARTLARENGLGIEDIDGTGPQGRVQAEDVRSVLDQSTAISAPVAFKSETGALSVTRSKGGTGTPVVLIHGFAGDAMTWAPVEVHIKHRPLIRIDLPGHGKSPKLKVNGFADLTKIVRGTLDALSLDKAHLVGHSLGGALCLALADTRPRSIDSVTLISPAGLGPDVNGAVLEGIGRATRTDSLAPWLRQLVADDTLITDAFVRLAMAPRTDANLRAAQQALAGSLFPDSVQAFDLRAALARLEMPARIIWGKADQIIPWRHALNAHGNIALHLFEGIGHVPHFEAPEEVGKILKASL